MAFTFEIKHVTKFPNRKIRVLDRTVLKDSGVTETSS